MKFTRLHAVLLASAALVSGPGIAHAQDQPGQGQQAEDPDRLDEIVVTAERRETSLATTPIAVSVLGGEDLEKRQVRSVLDLATSLPSVNMSTFGGQAQISIRGLGLSVLKPGDDGRVAFYSDGIYVSRPTAQLASFFDIERVEVLRGPQGTLFGRNATGGAFSIITRKPAPDDSGYLNVTAGNYGLFETEGALNAALSDKLSARLAFKTVSRNGFGTNLATGKDIDDAHQRAVRLSTLWEPSSDLSVEIVGSHYRHKEAGSNYTAFSTVTPGAQLVGQAFGGKILFNSRDAYLDTEPYDSAEVTSLSGNATWKLADGFSLKLLSGYVHTNHAFVSDADQTSFNLGSSNQFERSKQFSSELQLLGELPRLHWVAGLYYFHERDYVENTAPLSKALFGTGPFALRDPTLAQGAVSFATLVTDAYAAYGQATYDITDRLSVTAGLRYSSEHRQDLNDTRQFDITRSYPPRLPLILAAGFPRNLSANFDSLDPKFSIEYKATDDIFLYASYTTAFKSGGFNWSSTQFAIQPEDITAYEGGIKTSWLDHRLTVNLSAFKYDYKDIQTTVVTFVPNTQILVLNAASAGIKGAEIELNALPAPGLRLDATFSFLDARFRKFATGDSSRPTLGVLNLSGNWLPQTPRYSLNLGIQYAAEIGAGKLTPRIEYQAVGKTYYTPFNLENTAQKPYGITNAYISFEHGNWTATAFVRNLTNEKVASGLFNQSGIFGGGGGYISGRLLPPRTYGLTVGYDF
jgi:iron complex outermembrane receptor protein